MKRVILIFCLISVMSFDLPVTAQEGGNIAAVYCTKAQPGKLAQFEEAAKKHMAWHGEKNDPWAWAAWNITTGPNAGQYCWGSFGHTWADFDNPGVSDQEDSADWQTNGAMYEEGGTATARFWRRLPGVSHPSGGEESMHSVLFFQTHFGRDEAFMGVIAEFHQAIQRAEVGWNYDWYMLENGGTMGTFALALPYENFAAMAPTGKNFPQILEEAYGKPGADALLAKWRKVVKAGRTEMSQGRPDLGHIPEQ